MTSIQHNGVHNIKADMLYTTYLLEILRIGGVKKHSRLERLMTDLRQRKRRSRHVFCKVLPRLIIKNPDTVIDAEAGMSPGQ